MKPLRQIPIGRVLLGLVLSALLVDGGLRLIEATPLWRVLPVAQPILGQPDRDLGFDFTPGISGVWPLEHRARVRINTLALRDVERTMLKPPGSYRIGLLGDSMVESLQVSYPATFGALAEHELRAQGYRVELINLAISGPDPIRQLLRLEKHGYPLSLDLVVANSSLTSFANDLLRDDSENVGYVGDGAGHLVRGYGFRQRFSQRQADTRLGQWALATLRKTPLLRVLYLRGKGSWREILGLPTIGPPLASARLVSETVTPSCQTATQVIKSYLPLWLDHKPAPVWSATAKFLDEFADSTRAHGVAVIYAIRDIPLTPAECGPAAESRAQLIAAIAAEFKRRDMRFVDWSSTVAELAGDDLQRLQGFGVNRGRGHLNYDGHRAWAAALIKILDLEQANRPAS